MYMYLSDQTSFKEDFQLAGSFNTRKIPKKFMKIDCWERGDLLVSTWGKNFRGSEILVKPESLPRRRSAVMPQRHEERQSQLLRGEALGDLTIARKSARSQAALMPLVLDRLMHSKTAVGH